MCCKFDSSIRSREDNNMKIDAIMKRQSIVTIAYSSSDSDSNWKM